ncbi:MAG: GDP-mannose dehydrogenase [Candidatus Bathyarchaeota archaeon]|nr:GDP-mannose dehydrogenase [Candidatus Bathyarchaeota archaeon]
MEEEKVLVIGLGEVGRTLFELLEESGKFDVYGLDIDESRMHEVMGDKKIPKTVDVIHICYRCASQQRFIQTSYGYITQFKPDLAIINSTVPPGTTQKIHELSKSPLLAHSPIRGMHESLASMKKDVQFWTKYVGGTTKEAAESSKNHFEKLGLKVKVLKGSAETELAKLFETIYRAWMIACFQEMHRISRHYGADFDQVVDMLEDIHRLRLNKPLHYPGVIGKHCLVPNTELLLSVYNSQFLRLILDSNEKRKEEIKDKQIAEETEKVKKRAESLQEELLKKLR